MLLPPAEGTKGKALQVIDLETTVVVEKAEAGDASALSWRTVKQPAGAPGGAGGEAETETLRDDDLGLAFFEDGSFSSGPLNLLEAAGDAAPGGEAPPVSGGAAAAGLDLPEAVLEAMEAEAALSESTTRPVYSTVEQCICLGANRRVRLRCLLSARREVAGDGEGEGGPGALIVEPLRVSLFEERWVGAAREGALTIDRDDGDGKRLGAAALSSAPRFSCRGRDVDGEWSVLEASAVPEPDGAGQARQLGTRARMVMSLEERLETWRAGSALEDLAAAADGDDGDDAPDLDGVLLCLPGGTFLGLEMREAPGGGGPKGVCVSLGWEVEPGHVRVLEREYAGADGGLLEVRSRSCLRGGYKGLEM